MRRKRTKPEPEPHGPPDDGTVRFLLTRPSSIPEYERYTVRLPKVNIDLERDAAEKLARDISRALRKANVRQPPTIELQGEETEILHIAVADSIKAIESEVEREREETEERDTLLSIGDGTSVRLDFDQAWTLMSWIEMLGVYEEAIGRPENFYYDDDRFNQLFMRLQDATSPGWSHPSDLDGIVWP